MKDEREPNPGFLRTRLAVLAAILAVGIAALASMTCRKPVAPLRTANRAPGGLMSPYDAAREADIIASRARSLAGDTVTAASVMWGSFATPATCGERTCGPSTLPAPGIGARGACSGRG